MRHPGVSDGSDGVRPPRRSHSAWMEIYFADALQAQGYQLPSNARSIYNYPAFSLLRIYVKHL